MIQRQQTKNRDLPTAIRVLILTPTGKAAQVAVSRRYRISGSKVKVSQHKAYLMIELILVVLRLLRGALAQLKNETALESKIIDRLVKDVSLVGLTNVQSTEFTRFHLDDRWWLDRFFNRIRMSFIEGAFLIYFLIELPRISFIIWSFTQTHDVTFVSFQIDVLLRDILFIPVPIIILNLSYRSLVRLNDTLNEYLRLGSFKVPVLLSDYTLEKVSKIEDEYLNNYLKPMSFKTLQLCFDLSYNKYYNIGFAIVVGASAVLIGHFTPFYFYSENAPKELFPIWYPITLYMYFVIWFVAALITWIILSSLCIASYSGRYVFDIIPQKPLYHYYKRMIEQAAWFWKMGGLVVAAQVPSLYVETRLFPKLGPTGFDFLYMVLFIAMAILTLGTIIALYCIQYGMTHSKERKMKLMESELSELRKLCYDSTKDGKYARQYESLLAEYKDLHNNVDSSLNKGNVLIIMGSIAGPPAAALPFIVEHLHL